MNKLYAEENVKSIADAIRLKNDGGKNTYTIRAMSESLLLSPFRNVPDYHYTEAGRVIKSLLELKEIHQNNICFGTISDNHVDSSDEKSMTSARHATFALEYVGTLAQCDFVTNLGDNCAGTNIDNDDEYKNSVYMEQCSRFALTSQTGYSLVGNHDKSNSTQKLYDLMGKFNTFNNFGSTKIRGFGYKDYDDKKVRVICLNTCDYWNKQGGNGMSYEQKDFLMRALDLSAKNEYENWTIIIMSHIPLDFLGGDYNKGSDLKAILKAYCDGDTVSITVNSSYADAENESDSYGGTLTYNYFGKNAPKVINIHGHIHNNAYGKLTFIDDNTQLDIYRLATANSSFNGNATTDRYTSYGNYSITKEEGEKIKKIANTKADTSATFYFIDLDSQIIYSIGYGADIDRTVIYKDATIHTISYDLQLCSSSNSSQSVIDGTSYTTTIVPTGTDGTIKNVMVTMNGIDITSSVYSDGIITIPNVSGDVTITAVAEIPLLTQTITPHLAPRSTWHGALQNGVLTLGNSNLECALGTSDENDLSYTDRNGKTFYLIPVGSKYCKVTVNYSSTDNLEISYEFQLIKNTNGVISSISASGKNENNSFTWNKGSGDYLLISLKHTDESTKWDWNNTGIECTITFSNQ